MRKRAFSCAAAGGALEAEVSGLLQLGHAGDEAIPSTAAIAALLRRCGEESALKQGRRLHAHIVARRRHHGTFSFLSNLLVQMYGRCGSPSEARAAFDAIPRRNVFSWSLLMGAYAHNGCSDSVLLLYWEMLQRGIAPDNQVIFLLAIAACAQLGPGFLRHGRAIHDRCSQSGLCSDALDSAILHMYGKCSSLAEAEGVFQRAKSNRNVATWSAMISAYAQNGHPRLALNLFREMDAIAQEAEQLRPNYVTLLAAVEACSLLGSLDEGRAIYTRVRNSDAVARSSNAVGNALIGMFSKCSSVEDALEVFGRMEERNVLTWNTMISAFAQHGDFSRAIHLYRTMDPEGIKQNGVTFVAALGVCAALSDVEEGRKIHSRLVDAGYGKDVTICNALINMYGKCGRLREARQVFGGTPEPNLITWNSMISGYAQNGQLQEAIEFYDRMEVEGARVEPDAFTYTSILDACSRESDLVKGRAVHGKLQTRGIPADGAVGNALITMYGKCGCVEEAKVVFDGMLDKDVVSWTAMVTAYAQNGYGREALKVYHSMDVAPNEVTLISTLDACSLVGDLHEGRKIHRRIKMRGGSLGNAVVNMYAKCGCLDEASAVFGSLEARNVVCWSTLVTAYAHHGHGTKVLELLGVMCLDGITPDLVTFVNILVGCSHAGLLHEGRSVFVVVMRDDWSLEPHLQHYKCMIDLLARAGWLEEAVELMGSMPFEADDDAWMTLLGSCRLAGDVGKGLDAGKQIASSRPGSYVALSNIMCPSLG